MNHYANYIKERENAELIWDDKGFVTYKKVDKSGSVVYIMDIYVVPEKRNIKVASRFADMVVEKNPNCSLLVGSVSLGANNSRSSVRVLRGYGFKFHKLVKGEKMLYFIKEIK